ncbi:MAG: hypothetical protein HYU49_00935 [Candidatus Levybacteria bacterium]|nr:hypothetical protein [Candidatus Levybacteria bacterium]
MVNLSNITKDGKALYLAYDQGMEHGTSDFDDENVDPNYILGIAIEGEYKYTVYVGSAFESKMTSEFSQIVRDAHRENMPVIGWMYPRGRSVIDKDERELIAYAARMGLELGADIVKVKYPGSLEALKWVVESAGKTKVVVSGGVKEEEETFLGVVRTVMKAGAAGMAVGRNVWQSKDPIGMTEKLKEIIFK